ncbi:PREDICTED: circumsporozoite protein-like isoform X4 [Chinchilla lanigera]|uniref:circumsporozoite protein-like isoform X3 n=1 Tax=Chinchilla lanigera TaxID=34839 RepID=UPI0006967A64|nr:PREDICTED: circumsporozoite protein-like isoform X3 [Chinchilla lanigera]XP_013358691.1 PREDICTED: circumsporozoite protein-like isoform X4 [Chinchilla lanigera]
MSSVATQAPIGPSGAAADPRPREGILAGSPAQDSRQGSEAPFRAQPAPRACDAEPPANRKPPSAGEPPGQPADLGQRPDRASGSPGSTTLSVPGRASGSPGSTTLNLRNGEKNRASDRWLGKR